MILDSLVAALDHIISSFQQNLYFTCSLIAFLWLVNLLNVLCKQRLLYLGIYPRSLRGLIGIFFAPILHRDFNHLFFNSIPLFILTNLLLMEGRMYFYIVTLFIVVVSGLLLWLFGRRVIYIGASNVILGYFGYLLSGAYYKLSVSTAILAILALYYCGGLTLALFPSARKDVSWAGHVFGFIAGVGAAYLFHITS